MANIVINVDEPVFAQRTDKTLAAIIRSSSVKWPPHATAATQESDGEIIFWNCEPEKVQEARKKAALDVGLIPILGVGHSVSSYYHLIENREVVAVDWESAVVTIESITHNK